MALEKANCVCSSMPSEPEVTETFREGTAQDLEGALVLVPEIDDRGLALGEGGQDLVDAVALSARGR